MDIRKWFTSPKSKESNSSSGKKNQKDSPSSDSTSKRSSSKGELKKSKKRIVDSDSDDEFATKKHKAEAKQTDSDTKRSGSPSTGRGRKKPKLDGVKVSGKDEDAAFGSSESDVTRRRTSPRKVPQLKLSKALPEKVKPLKAITVSDFFGGTPSQRPSAKRAPETKVKKSSSKLETNHDDEDFEKTLQQLEKSPSKKDDRKPSKIEQSKKEEAPRPTLPKGKAVKKSSVDIELIPPPPKSKEKKVVESTPPEKKPFPKANRASYMSYLQREGPRSLGSKEIPEGDGKCLKGKSFVITGVLDAIERDDAKALILSCAGKVMTTLTKNTTYLVAGRDAGASKLEKAEALKTTILDEDSLLELIRNTTTAAPKKNDPLASNGDEEENDVFEPPAEKKSPKKIESPNKEVLPEAVVEKNKAEKSTMTNINMKNLYSIKRPSDPDRSSHLTKPGKMLVGEDLQSSKGLKSDSSLMWVDKYKPTTLKQVIGQQGDKSNAQKLLKWLRNWSRNAKNARPAYAGRWNSNDDGSAFKAALLSGSPGVGKTTTAHLVCKEAGFDYLELNASDTRSKKSLQSAVSELLVNQSLFGCFTGQGGGTVTKRHAVIMDEVDGMAGNQDRGGVQELIGYIKASRIPIICICNDRNHPKIRSLSNYCFDLRFARPRVEQIKAAMMSIAFKEGIKVSPSVLQDVITASNQDVRQVLHNLSMWTSSDKKLTEEQAKKDIAFGVKHVKMSPFDALREVFAIGLNKKATITDKSDLFFHDYSLIPLFVQENYVHVLPSEAGGDKQKHLRLLSDAANSICMGDVVDKVIRSGSAWNLLPTQAMFASVIPGELLTGHLKQMVSFPSWLGKNSNRNHMNRVLQELQMHMRMRITGNKTDINLEYLPLLHRALTRPLLDREGEGIQDVLEVMQYYCLLREDFDSIIDLSWSQNVDPRSKISTKVKSAFTRTYNKECAQNPYAVTTVTKKKRGANTNSEGGLPGNEDEDYASEDDDQDDKIENDAMIKVKKQPSKKQTTNDAGPSGSKKGAKTESKKGRAKK